MSIKAFYPLFAVALVAFCDLLNTSSVAAMNPNFAVTKILSPKEGETLFNLYFRGASFIKESKPHYFKETFWMPQQSDVAQAEAGLTAYSQLTVEAVDQKWDQFGYRPHDLFLTSDLRQYAGVSLDGRRLIMIDGLSTASVSSVSGIAIFPGVIRITNGDPGSLVYRYSDGGTSFRAAYDPESCRIVYLVYDTFVERQPVHSSYSDQVSNFG